MAIVEEYRQDRGALLPPQWAGETLFVEGYVCRPGIYEYRNDDGTITRELIREDMLRECAIGLSRVPCTLEHPGTDVDSTNWQTVAVGDAADDVLIIEDNGYQRVKMAVRRKDAQNDILSGKRKECSPGYVAKIDKTPGRHEEYGEYDAEQIGRKYNHIAFVTDARGGPRIAVRVDGKERLGAEMVDTIRADANQEPGEGPMPLSRSVVRHLALLGADIRRIDTAEKALEWLSHRWDAQDYPVVPPGKSNDGTYPMSGDRGMSQMGGMPPMTPDAGMGGMGGMDYPMTPDGQPMYQDAEGNPMTQDAYMKALEDENNAMRQQLGQTADQELMTEMTPMAEEMDVPVDKTDSGYALAVKIASKAVGEQLHPENTPPAFIEGIIRKLKADRADSSAGREAGERAWIQGREDSQTPESRQRREDRRGSPEPGGEEHHRSLSDLALDQYRDSFKRRRDAARGVI